jgi:hypothetical protein
MSENSSGSVVSISRSKRRYVDIDALLKGFIGKSGATAKEIAIEVLGWSNERYSNAPKRCHDLFAHGYLEILEARVCGQTGKAAHTYRITDKGLGYLQCKGFVIPIEKINGKALIDGKSVLKDLRKMLGS